MENKTVDIQQLSNFLLDFAVQMMSAGAHTSRIVRNIIRIGKCFGYDVDMTLFQLNVTMTVKDHDDSSIRRTYVRKIGPLHTNFRTISDLSALSWRVYDERLTFTEMTQQYNNIVSQPVFSRWVVLFMVAIANASFCKLFSGDIFSMGAVFTGTFVAFFIRQELLKRHIDLKAVVIACAFISSLIAALLVLRLPSKTPEIAIATSVLFLIPGVPLINAIVDTLEGHVLIGLSRAINAGILIVGIALGMYFTLLILGLA